jgi:hypothetical protein
MNNRTRTRFLPFLLTGLLTLVAVAPMAANRRQLPHRLSGRDAISDTTAPATLAHTLALAPR